MAAKIVCPPPEQWPLVRSFIQDCLEGAIVISPQARTQLRERTGRDPEELGVIEYDHSGEPDLMLDVIYDANLPGTWYALNAVRDALRPGLNDGDTT